MTLSILHRLEKRKLWLVWGEAESGRRRKYYRLHRSGASRFAVQRHTGQSCTTLQRGRSELCRARREVRAGARRPRGAVALRSVIELEGTLLEIDAPGRGTVG